MKNYALDDRMMFGVVPDLEIIENCPRLQVASFCELPDRNLTPHVRVNDYYGWRQGSRHDKDFFCIDIETHEVIGEYTVDTESVHTLVDFVRENKTLLMMVWRNKISCVEIIHILRVGVDEWSEEMLKYKSEDYITMLIAELKDCDIIQ